MLKAGFMVTVMVVVLLFGTGIGCQETVPEETPTEQTIPEGTTLEGEDIAGLTYEEFLQVKERILQEWNDREIKLLLAQELPKDKGTPKETSENSRVENEAEEKETATATEDTTNDHNQEENGGENSSGEYEVEEDTAENMKEEKVVGVSELGMNFYFSAADEDNIMSNNAAAYQLELEYSSTTMQEKITELFPPVLEEPQNAELFVETEPTIKEHRDGIRIDLDGSVETIVENAREDEATLPLEIFSPEFTTEDIERKGVKELIASYSTEFNPRVTGRAANIQLVADHIDHNMVSPGGTFSFNQTAGPYNSDRGFQSAPVFRDGTVTTGIGGGVCQVSSTLYNAALLAGMETVERYSHSLPVWYVPLARDAAVSYGNIDLKFKNELDNHIYIRMEVDTERGLLEAKFFGTKQLEVKVGSKIEKRVEPPVEEKIVEGIDEKKVVEEGQQGYEAISWRYVDGEYEFLSRDYYKPLKRVVEIPPEKEPEEPRGPEKPEAPEEPEEPGEPEEPQEPAEPESPERPEEIEEALEAQEEEKEEEAATDDDTDEEDNDAAEEDDDADADES